MGVKLQLNLGGNSFVLCLEFGKWFENTTMIVKFVQMFLQTIEINVDENVQIFLNSHPRLNMFFSIVEGQS